MFLLGFIRYILKSPQINTIRLGARYLQIRLPHADSCLCENPFCICEPTMVPHLTAQFAADVNSLTFRPHQQHDVHLRGVGGARRTLAHMHQHSALVLVHKRTHEYTKSHLRFLRLCSLTVTPSYRAIMQKC